MMTMLVMPLAVKASRSLTRLDILDWISKRILLRTITTDMRIPLRKMLILLALQIVKFSDPTLLQVVLRRTPSKVNLVTRFPLKTIPMKILEI